MNKKLKKLVLYGGLMSTVFFLAGCIRIDQQTGQPAGFFSQLMYDYLVVPTSLTLDWLASLFGSYGFAIMAVTIIVHLIILPLSLRQRRSMMEQQVQMSAIQPAINEIQQEMQQTNNPQEKQYLQEEMMGIYQENNINILGQLTGCLPLLIQMPIFLAVFHVLQNSPSIATATFFGIRLGESSILLGLLAGAVYLAQAKVMQQGMPEAQRKQAGAMTMMTPIMLTFISVTSPAGLALYFLTGGIFTTIQSLVINNHIKPKLEAEMEEKYGEQKVIQRKEKPAHFKNTDTDSSGQEKQQPRNVNAPKKKNNHGRNAGKQQRFERRQ